MFESLRKFNSRFFPIIIVAIVASIIGGVITAKILVGSPMAAEEKPTAQQAAMLPVGTPNAVADMVERVAPAVVKIETTYKRINDPRKSDNPFFNDPFFRQFFDSHPMEERESNGLGSGFIFNNDGYVLTNDHVVRGADKIRVTVKAFAEPLEAKLVGSDASLDLAVLKVSPPPGKLLPSATLGDSGKVRVGEWVVAIGDPYGMDWTVTAGVISAKGRPLTIGDDQGRPRRYKNLIQTDAAINPGNSGGPLLNLAGEVIGINTAVNAVAQGIGFAIPINTAKDVLKDLVEHGKVVRSYLGVQIVDLNKEMSDALELGVQSGVVVMDVVPGGPAEKAGLQRYDVILEFNRQKVESTEELINLVRKTKAGSTIALLIMRDRETKIVTARIEQEP